METIIAVEGEIQKIEGNKLTINNIEIEVTQDHPILNLIEVGDTVRVEGSQQSNGIIAATVVDNITDTDIENATVGLDGPIAKIEQDRIILNGILIQFKKDDPLLEKLKIGDFLSIQGNFATIDDVIVLVVVNASIIDTTDTGSPSNCWWHQDPMGMGHWHCDGMGMGDPAMGMGEPGMGMGNPPSPPVPPSGMGE
jgi:hypothetical protein